MRAMILAAGYGTRLWPLTLDRAKPAIPFLGRPLVGYVAEYLARHGCREIAVNLHHEGESVRAALGDGSRFGVRLEYFEEPEILGPGGALDNARAWLEGGTFVVVNGKIATDIDLGAALHAHRDSQALATLVLRPNAAREKYSTVEIRDGLLLGFGGYPPPAASDQAGDAAAVSQTQSLTLEEKRKRSGALSLARLPGGEAFITREPRRRSGWGGVPLMFTGIHILEPRVFDYVPRKIFSDTITDVYPRARESGERLGAHVADGYWYELSTIPRYLDTSVALMRAEGRDVQLGEGSRVGEGADVRDAILWENVVVEAGARVRRAVLGAGVRVGAGETVEDAAVVRAELVRGEERPAKALAGEFRGDNFVVPLPR